MPPLHQRAALTLVGALTLGLLGPPSSRTPGAGPPAAGEPAPAVGYGSAALPSTSRAALFGGALAAPATSTIAPPRASGRRQPIAEAPRCNATQRPGTKARYEGRSASKVYDRLFRPGPRVPHLAGWVPQGLATWQNWNGRGHTLLLLGMYRRSSHSYLVGVDPRTGRHVGTVRAKAAHFGALGVDNGWLIAQDNLSGGGSAPAVRRYKLATLRKQMSRAIQTGDKPFVAAHGSPQRLYGASFMAVHDGSMWIGRYAKKKPARMYRYTVAPSGSLRAVEGPWPVPSRTQGVLVTDRHFVFTASAGGKRGTMTVVKRSAPAKPVACLWTPSLPQTMTQVAGRVYTAYESGAAKFAVPGVLNRIAKLHTGLIDSLTRLLR